LRGREEAQLKGDFSASGKKEGGEVEKRTRSLEEGRLELFGEKTVNPLEREGEESRRGWKGTKPIHGRRGSEEKTLLDSTVSRVCARRLRGGGPPRLRS